MLGGGPATAGGFNNLMNAGARIAKPLRGGGGAPNSGDGLNGGGPGLPIISSLSGSDGGNKRSSWFFNNR